jgi:hypothetical protein
VTAGPAVAGRATRKARYFRQALREWPAITAAIEKIEAAGRGLTRDWPTLPWEIMQRCRYQLWMRREGLRGGRGTSPFPDQFT